MLTFQVPDWSIALTALGLAGLYGAAVKPHLGWIANLAAQPLWFAYGLQVDRWWFAVAAPVYAGAFAWHLIHGVRRRCPARRCVASWQARLPKGPLLVTTVETKPPQEGSGFGSSMMAVTRK